MYLGWQANPDSKKALATKITTTTWTVFCCAAHALSSWKSSAITTSWRHTDGWPHILWFAVPSLHLDAARAPRQSAYYALVLAARNRFSGPGRLSPTGLTSLLQHDSQHATQWLRRTPQQLISHRKRGKIFATHGELAQPADRDAHGAGHGRRRQRPQGRFALVRHYLHPLVGLRQHALDFVYRHVALQLDSQCLAVTAHGPHAYAQALHRNGIGRVAQDLVGLGAALPLLAAHAVAEILVDPGNQ